MSYDVTLPIADSPKFPDTCINCGKVNPDSLAELWTFKRSIWGKLGPTISIGKRVIISAPACRVCVQKIAQTRKWSFFLRFIISAFFAVVLTELLFMWKQPKQLMDLVTMALDPIVWLVFISATFIFYTPCVMIAKSFFLSNHFDLVGFRRFVCYEFNSRKVAELFATENGVLIDEDRQMGVWESFSQLF